MKTAVYRHCVSVVMSPGISLMMRALAIQNHTSMAHEIRRSVAEYPFTMASIEPGQQAHNTDRFCLRLGVALRAKLGDVSWKRRCELIEECCRSRIALLRDMKELPLPMPGEASHGSQDQQEGNPNKAASR